MDQQTRASIKFISVAFFFTTAVLFIEYAQVEKDLRIQFLFSKLFILIFYLIAWYRLKKNKKFDFMAYFLTCLAMCLYPALGQIFRPTYEYAMLPLFLLIGMFVPFRRNVIFTFQAVGTILFCIVYYLNYEKNLKAFSEMNVFDNLFSFITFGVVAGAAVYILNFERQLKYQAQTRYTLIGAHATAVIHDLKNLMATPRIQIENLKNFVQLKSNQISEQKLFSEIIEQIDELEQSLEQTTQIALRFNQMAVLTNSEKTLIHISQVIADVKAILKKRLQFVELNIQGDKKLNVDNGFMTSLFLNLFMNSLQALSHQSTKKIEIIISEDKILFQDNGPGFTTEVLHALGRKKQLSTKQNGTGLGLVIIREAAEELGANVSFYNHMNGGACVELYWV